MYLHCPHCGARVPAKNINIHLTIAVCPDCDTLFEFDAAAIKGKTKYHAVPTPKYFQTKETPGQLEISYRWLDDRAPGYIVFGMGWNVLVIGIALALFNKGWTAVDALCLTLPVMIGAVMAYYALALWVNKTIIIVDATTLTIRHTPVPVAGNTRLPRAFIQAIYYDEIPPERTEEQPSYDLYVTLNNRDDKLLLKGLQRNQIFFILQNLERYLRLEADSRENAEINVTTMSEDEYLRQIPRRAEG